MRTAPWTLVAALVLAGCLGSAPPGVLDDADPSHPLDVRLSPSGVDAMEVAIASNPEDPAHLVAASNLRGDGHSGFGVYVSRDGGRSWDAGFLDPHDVGPSSRYTGLSDPVVAFDGDGTVYLSGLAYLPSSAVFVAKSYDGGRTWPTVHVVDESDPATEFNDKEWMAVGPDGTIVVAWAKEPVIDMLRSVEYETGLDVDVSDVVVSRSTDGGATWSDPVEVDRGRHNNGTALAFTPNGAAHLIYYNYERGGIDHLWSDDAGWTWSDPVQIADATVVPPYPDYQRMHTLPGLAAGPDGSLVAVWHDGAGGDADVRAVASPDGGRTWGEPVEVRSDDAEQLYPWVDVGPDGRVHVSFYDANGTDGDLAFRYVRAVADGVAPDGSLAFAEPRSVANRTFDAAGRNGVLGDYTGIEVNERGTFPAWADGRDGASSIRAARIPHLDL